MQNVHDSAVTDSDKVLSNGEGKAEENSHEKFCTSSVDSEDEISEVDASVIGEVDDEEDDDEVILTDGAGAIGESFNSNIFLSRAAASSEQDYSLSEFIHTLHPEAPFDTDTQARLVALIEAAVASSTDPDVLRRLTNSVSSALDEAASALARMRSSEEAQRFQNANLSSSSSNYSSSMNSCSSSSSGSSRSSSRASSYAAAEGQKEIVDAVNAGDTETVQTLLNNGANVNENTEEGDTLLLLAASSGYYDLSQVLISMRANVNDRGKKGDLTPLMEAATSGHLNIVKLLLDHGADINAVSASGNTALIYATIQGHSEVMNTLLEYGANLEVFNENGHTALMEAATTGVTESGKLLLSYGALINNAGHEFKESPLTLAAYKGHYDMCRYLLKNGALVDHKTDEMHTALMEASMEGHIEIVRLLLEFGASCDMPPESFESPLTLAACGGHTDIVMLLIGRGANIEEVNDEGYTPLMEAAREGHLSVISMLMAHGADVNSQTEETNETALSLACCGGFKDCVEYLMNNGADIELGSSTPLMEAAQEGHKDLVEYLLQHTANVNAVTPTGDTALTYACENGHTDVADLLLQANAHLEHESEGGRTPLMKACRAGHYATVQYLISKGANIHRTTVDNDHTPLSLACAGGHVRVVELLLTQGANPFHPLKDNSNMVLEASKGGHHNVVRLLIDYPNSLMAGVSGVGNDMNSINANSVADLATGFNYMQLQDQEGHVIMTDVDSVSDACLTGTTSYPVTYTRPKDNTLVKDAATNVKHPKFQCPQFAEGVTENHPFAYSTTQKQLVEFQKNMCRDDNSRTTTYQIPPVFTEGFPPSLPPANIPVQERRKLVPNKKQLDKRIIQQKFSPITPRRPPEDNDQEDLVKNWEVTHPKYEQEFRKNEFKRSMDQVECGCPMHNADGEQTCNYHHRAPDNENLQHQISQTISNQGHLTNQLPQYINKKTTKPINFEDSTLLSQVDKMKLQYRRQPIKPKKLNTGDIIRTNGRHGLSQIKTVSDQPKNKIATKSCDPTKKRDLITPDSETHLCGPCIDEERVKYDPSYSNHLSNAIDLNTPTSSNNDTALTLAAAGGFNELVTLLISRGANIEHADKKGYTPLLLAAASGHAETVGLLAKYSCNLEAQADRTKDTALCLACSNGRVEVVCFLVDAGANKEHRNVSDYTPLSIAASNGYASIVRILLEYGAEINARTGSKLGISPLMLASMNGNVPCVKLLLEKGADVNAQIETNRNTALTLASFQGRHEVVRLLLQKKANIEHRAKTGLTPLMEAASGGHCEVGSALINRGADVNAAPVPTSRDTALTIAADKGHLNFVKLLIRHEVQVDVKNKKGNSPLWLAASNGHIEVVKSLVEAKANVDSEDNRKVSCITAAFKKGHLEIVQYLSSKVNQLPLDSELERYINTIVPKDKESKLLKERCRACYEVLRTVKEEKVQQADKNASDLLQMIHDPRFRDESRKKRVDKRKTRKEKKKAKQAEALKREKKQQSTSRDRSPEKKEEPEEKLEEKDGDSGIDSNSQTSATSEPKVLPPEPAPKKKKKKKEKEKPEPEVEIELPPPPPPPKAIKQIEKLPNIIKKELPKKEKKQPKIKEEVKEKLDITSLLEMKTVGSKRKQVGSDINSLDTFGDVEGYVPIPVPPKAAPIPKKEEWREVARKSKRVSVPNNAISRVIGRGGCNINAIREASGAHIEVEKQGKSQGDRMIIIKGTVDATKLANNLINALVNNPDKDLSELMPKSYGRKVNSKYRGHDNAPTSASAGSPKRSVANGQQGSKSPAVRQLFPSTKPQYFMETQTFASKLSDTKSPKALKNDSSPPGGENSQYSIFDNPIVDATQEVAFGQKKSFARAASGAVSKIPLGKTQENSIMESTPQPVADARRAPGYRVPSKTTPVKSNTVISERTLSLANNNVVRSEASTNNTFDRSNISTSVPLSSSGSVSSSHSSAVAPAPLARSAPGTPVASPSLRSYMHIPQRQIATPPPKPSETNIYNTLGVSSKTPPPNFSKEEIPKPNPVHYPTAPLEQLALSQIAQDRATAANFPFALRNSATIADLSNVSKNQLVQRSMVQQQPQVQLNLQHNPPQPQQPPVQPPPQQPHSVQQANIHHQQAQSSYNMIPHQQHQFSSNDSNLNIMNSMRFSTPPANTQVFNTQGPVQSNLNPNAPHFRSQSMIPSNQHFITNRAQIASVPNHITPMQTVSLAPYPNVAFDNLQITNVDVSGTISRNYRDTTNSNHLPVADERQLVKLQPIGTERAQKMSSERVNIPRTPDMTRSAHLNMASEPIWRPEIAAQMATHSHEFQQQQQQQQQHHQHHNAFYTLPEVHQSFNQQMWGGWGPGPEMNQ